MGSELVSAGYLILAKEKFQLYEKEQIICDQISTILQLCDTELTLDNPQLQTILNMFSTTTTTTTTTMASSDENGNPLNQSQQHPQQLQQLQQLQFQLEENQSNQRNNQDQDIEQKIKRQRDNNYNHLSSHILVGIDEWSQSQIENNSKLFSQQQQLQQQQQQFNPQNSEIDTIIRSQSSQENEPLHENILSANSDHTIIGSLSQISNIGSNLLPSNEINLSSSSNYSSLIGSIPHSTPSPEIIQTQRGIKRSNSPVVGREVFLNQRIFNEVDESKNSSNQRYPSTTTTTTTIIQQNEPTTIKSFTQ